MIREWIWSQNQGRLKKKENEDWIYNWQEEFSYDWIWCGSRGALRGKREACHVGKCWAEVQKFPLSRKGDSLPGAMGIAAFSFSEAPLLSPCLASPITVLKLFYGEEGRICRVFFFSKSHIKHFTHLGHNLERLNLQNWFQRIAKVVQRFTE